MRYLDENTILNHKYEKNAFQWPLINICPMYWSSRNHTSKNFEEMQEEINQTMLSYSFATMHPKGTTTDEVK